jgi:hypothetical protein
MPRSLLLGDEPPQLLIFLPAEELVGRIGPVKQRGGEARVGDAGGGAAQTESGEVPFELLRDTGQALGVGWIAKEEPAQMEDLAI